jgi:hypothetical protein
MVLQFLPAGITTSNRSSALQGTQIFRHLAEFSDHLGVAGGGIPRCDGAFQFLNSQDTLFGVVPQAALATCAVGRTPSV